MTLPILDVEDLLHAIDHDLDLLRRMFDQYRSTLEKEFLRIERALGTQDFATLRDVAHKLEGMLGNFSSPAAIETVQRFHQAARIQDEAQTRDSFKTLQQRTQELSQALTAQLQK